jgi:hypothetical protein
VDPHDSAATFTLNLSEPGRGPWVVLRWHLASGCAEADPLHMEIADADRLPSGGDGDLLVAAAYLRLLDRLGAEHGPDVLRAAVTVRRDAPDPRMTLRGPGLRWGRLSPSRRVVVGVAPSWLRRGGP